MYTPVDVLARQVARELGIGVPSVGAMAFVIHDTRGYNRCKLMFAIGNEAERCVLLPDHSGLCKIITYEGKIERVIGRVPPPSLLKLSYEIYG